MNKEKSFMQLLQETEELLKKPLMPETRKQIEATRTFLLKIGVVEIE